jgi:two-component system LytT family response regulator
VRDRDAVRRDRAASGAGAVAADTPLREDDHVFVRDGERCWFVPVRSIRLLESAGNHTRVHFDREQPLLYRTIGSMEERLPARLFLRANRSQLVNLTYIESIGQWFSGSLKVTLRGGQEVEFSRRHAQAFRARMSL